MDDVREMRQLASEITSKGASIHDFLSQEVRMKNQRDQVLQRNYELGQIEAALQLKMKRMDAQISQKQEAIDSIASTEATLDQKIEKRNQELQRLRKRLETMKNIRYNLNLLFLKFDETNSQYMCSLDHHLWTNLKS